MKGYGNRRAQRGKVAYRTPSRWLAGQPEAFKQRPNTKLNKDGRRATIDSLMDRINLHLNWYTYYSVYGL